MWGLGYQLYPSVKIPELFPTPAPPSIIHSPLSRGVSFSRASMPLDKEDSPVAIGLGHGDLGGSVALCFPELKLGISILVNDILNGPMASQEILKFILNCFGYQPAWDVPYPTSQAIDDISAVINQRVVAAQPSTAALKREQTWSTLRVIPSTTR